MVDMNAKSNGDNSDMKQKLREINCDINPLSRGDGSAVYAQGSTCVLVNMLGPVEVKPQNLKVDEAYIECNFRPKVGLPTVKEKLIEAVVREACEAAIATTIHPRTMFCIHVQELDDCGGLVACAINGACLALLSGGVPMKFTVAAVHCILNEDRQIVLDPDHSHAMHKRASFTFVFDNLDKNLVALKSSGHITMDELNRAEKICRQASEEIFQFYRDTMKNFHQKTLIKHVNETSQMEVEVQS